METVSGVFAFVIANWKFFSGLLSVLLVWFGMKDKFVNLVEKAEKKYQQVKRAAKSRDVYKVAKTAYGVVSKIARKTSNTVDDKAAMGLAIAIELMEKLGWDKSEVDENDRDIIERIFDELHELEHLQLEAAHKSPVSNVASREGEIAAPLA